MADDVPPLPPSEPQGPRFAWFDGILEGRLGDAVAVREAARRVCAAGAGRMDVGVDGGRFSVLMDDAPIPAEKMTDANRRLLAGALAEIARASAGPVESTLRCTEVFRDEVRETLFLPDAGTIRALSRTRPVSDTDLVRGPGPSTPPAPSMGRGRLFAVLGLLAVAFVLVAWMGGWVDRLLSAKADAMTIDTGPFADYLDAKVERSWGDYTVTLRRGAGYPVETKRLDELRAKATTPAERAALDAVATGGKVWARLEDSTGRVLAAHAVELRPLIAGGDRDVEVDLPGRISATRIRLDLDAGPDDK